MNTYEEKREKLALLLIDLHNKTESVVNQAAMPDNHYNGEMFSFEVIDRVVVESYSILRDDVNIFRALEIIKRRLMSLNAEKEKMLRVLSMSYNLDFKHANVNTYRDLVRRFLPEILALSEQIERSLNERFGISNPYKTSI